MSSQTDHSDTNGAIDDTVKAATEKTKDMATDTVTAASATSQSAIDAAKARGQAAVDTAKSVSADAADKAVSATQSGLNQASSSADSIAQKLREQGEALSGPAADAAKIAASGLERGSAYLSDADVRSIMSQTQDMVRSNRTLALGLGAIFGLLLLFFVVRMARGSSE